MAQPAGARKSPSETRESFRRFVKDPTLSARHLRTVAQDPADTALRSLKWRIYLNLLPVSTEVWPESVRRHRRQWNDLSHDYLRAPDGTWLDGAGPHSQCHASTSSSSSSTVFDPLGSERENPWPAWYRDLDLRKVIRQDVERTFPDNDYFRLPHVQDSMTNILFVFAKLHIDVGYRQGMHEVLAIILWCIDQDSLADSATRSPKDDIELLANTVLSYDYVEHDAYAVYNILMTHMLSWYDPAQTVALPSNNGIQPTLVQPIVLKCARIHDMLRKVDSDLWKRMEELQIEPQIYGLRWLRLLFSREFPLADTLLIWDALLCDDTNSTLHLVDYICLAMLLRIRESLLDSDYTTFLQGLLRYPAPLDGRHRVELLVQQAQYLRNNTTNYGGAYVRRQNQQSGSEAGVKTGSRAEEEQWQRRASTPTGSTIKSPGINGANALYDQGRNIAEGLYGRAEALGINKAVFSTLGELRKSVQAYQQQQNQAVPTVSEIPSKPVWETVPAKNFAIDLKRLKAENVAMGNALATSLQILESKANIDDPAAKTALQTMSHIKDVLMGLTSNFNSSTVAPLISFSEAASATAGSQSHIQPPTRQMNLLDDHSPTMASSPSFPVVDLPQAPLQPFTFRDRLPSQSSKQNMDTAINSVSYPPPPEVPKKTVHSHQRSSSNASVQDIPHLQRAPQPPSDLHKPGGTSYPRAPPPSFVVGPKDQARPSTTIPSPLMSYGEWRSPNSNLVKQQGSKGNDPLGALI